MSSAMTDMEGILSAGPSIHRMLQPRRLVLAVVLALTVAVGVQAQTPITYQLSFPEREHHLMQVEATFTELPAGPLQLRMSRSSPGRYAVHEFAKNVFDVHVSDASGRPLAVTRPNPHEWD